MHAGLEARHDQAIVAEAETADLRGHVVSVEFSVGEETENGGCENIDKPQIAGSLIPGRRFANPQRGIDQGTKLRFDDMRLAHWFLSLIRAL